MGSQRATSILMLMPKAAVDEDNSTTTSEHDVGAARQVACVEPVAIAERVQQSPDN